MPGSSSVSWFGETSDDARTANSGSGIGSPTPRACGPSKLSRPPGPGTASSASAELHAEYARELLARRGSSGGGPPHSLLLLLSARQVGVEWSIFPATTLSVPMHAAVLRHCSTSNGCDSVTVVGPASRRLCTTVDQRL